MSSDSGSDALVQSAFKRSFRKVADEVTPIEPFAGITEVVAIRSSARAPGRCVLRRGQGLPPLSGPFLASRALPRLETSNILHHGVPQANQPPKTIHLWNT
jgi:hypothetical protein